ncbi:MAG: UbiD family decarboxylase [Candidatus Helarchaeales archaeon]
MNFREFLSLLDFKEFHQEFNLKFEVAALLKKFEGIPLKFSKQRIVGNIYSRPQFLLKGLGLKEFSEWIPHLIKARKNLGKLEEKGPQKDLEKTTLMSLPILTHYEKDAGPYITSGAVIATRNGRKNASVHRILPIDETHLTLRLVHRHLHEMFMDAKEHGEDLPVSICLGIPPSVQIAAATSLAAEEYELEFAAALDGGNLQVHDGLPESEIVIHGRILHDVVHPEGPFLDITGKYDIIREEPVIEISEVRARSDFIYHALLPASNDHLHLMGLPRVPFIHEELVKFGVTPSNIYLPPGGFGWLTCLIGISRETEFQLNGFIDAVLKGHYSLKKIVILDDDVDLTDPIEVERAIVLNCKFSRENPLILENVKGSSLDPRAEGDIGTKIIFDARRPKNQDPQKFEKGKIPVPPSFFDDLGEDGN